MDISVTSEKLFESEFQGAESFTSICKLSVPHSSEGQ